jgi:hypothetical protein
MFLFTTFTYDDIVNQTGHVHINATLRVIRVMIGAVENP